MTNYPYRGVDTSWPQGKYAPGSEAFIIVGAFTDDGGTMRVQDTYHEQVDAALAAGKDVGIYCFNGSSDPEAYADFCCENLYEFGAGHTMWLDDETQSNKHPAWTPAQNLVAANEFKSRLGLLPGTYFDVAEMTTYDWSDNAAEGQLAWLAWPSTTQHAMKWFSEAAMWQYGSAGGIDHDYAAYSQPEMRAMMNGTDPKEDAMPLVQLLQLPTASTVSPALNGMLCAVAPGFFRAFGSEADFTSFAATLGLTPIQVTEQQFDLIISVLQIPISECVANNAWLASSTVQVGADAVGQIVSGVKGVIPTKFTAAAS
jgi:hypothetical protein